MTALMEDYRRVADEVAADIAAGRLRPGDRLPPQRVFARQHAIAASTAARVYQELARRGLTVGEVGRGTFVRAAAPARTPLSPNPRTAGSTWSSTTWSCRNRRASRRRASPRCCAPT
ncbi:winged helix-turn-helix domain-containing protein [Nonomuraea sp. NBC_01738]|uniref:winged helix-turn-helix domain-containing protein n=1 Tax=Nonomuraea sp. NBC_01738 TaxID=2976003 RepID=UPI002E117ED1|nr:winged helix-turn-helix domain-containing protein [Nonomuraea sp. NBC_01738]